MRTLLSVPGVFVMELLDALMCLIPARLWAWLWRDVRTSEEAGAMDLQVRVAIVLLVAAVAVAVQVLA